MASDSTTLYTTIRMRQTFIGYIMRRAALATGKNISKISKGRLRYRMMGGPRLAWCDIIDRMDPKHQELKSMEQVDCKRRLHTYDNYDNNYDDFQVIKTFVYINSNFSFQVTPSYL